MPEFALVFHVAEITSPDRLARRNAAARDWALAHRRDGSIVHAFPLELAARVVDAEQDAHTEPTDLAAVLIVTARDLDAATALAHGHPGLAYGTRIEVRPLKVVPH